MLPPGHYKQVHEPRHRGVRERWVLGVGGVLVALLVGVTLFSLTSHAAKSGGGCLNFEYTMVMGAENVHECGVPARKLCASPQRAANAQGNIAGLEDDLIAKLPQNCRQAGLPFKTAS
jgi:hypothetical protein